jgi:hypothetical protein
MAESAIPDDGTAGYPACAQRLQNPAECRQRPPGPPSDDGGDPDGILLGRAQRWLSNKTTSTQSTAPGAHRAIPTVHLERRPDASSGAIVGSRLRGHPASGTTLHLSWNPAMLEASPALLLSPHLPLRLGAPATGRPALLVCTRQALSVPRLDLLHLRNQAIDAPLMNLRCSLGVLLSLFL